MIFCGRTLLSVITIIIETNHLMSLRQPHLNLHRGVYLEHQYFISFITKFLKCKAGFGFVVLRSISVK